MARYSTALQNVLTSQSCASQPVSKTFSRKHCRSSSRNHNGGASIDCQIRLVSIRSWVTVEKALFLQSSKRVCTSWRLACRVLRSLVAHLRSLSGMTTPSSFPFTGTASVTSCPLSASLSWLLGYRILNLQRHRSIPIVENAPRLISELMSSHMTWLLSAAWNKKKSAK
jgi:hypothetical protein